MKGRGLLEDLVADERIKVNNKWSGNIKIDVI
jgi:hypothetical protein